MSLAQLVAVATSVRDDGTVGKDGQAPPRVNELAFMKDIRHGLIATAHSHCLKSFNIVGNNMFYVRFK